MLGKAVRKNENIIQIYRLRQLLGIVWGCEEKHAQTARGEYVLAKRRAGLPRG